MEKARNTEKGYLRHVGNGRVYPLKFFQKCPFKFLFLLLMDSLKDPARGAASPHCFIAFPGYSLRSWEPLFSYHMPQPKLCTVFLAGHYAVLCYTNSCACPYSLNGIQQLLPPPPSLAQTFQHCLWCCCIKSVRSVFRPLSSVFGALHSYCLRLNYPYSSILQLVSSLSVVVVFL